MAIHKSVSEIFTSILQANYEFFVNVEEWYILKQLRSLFKQTEILQVEQIK